MNARRVHELMRKHFPAYEIVAMEWTNVAERDGPNVRLLEALVAKHVSAEEVLVEVHRKLGGLVPRSELVPYLVAHYGQGGIRVADRGFTSFLVVTHNGVVTGWRKDAKGDP